MLPARKIFNNQIKLTGKRATITGFVNGERIKLYYRKFRDKRGRTVRILSGPGLRNLTKDS
jgi:hypothetical protein